MKASDLADSQRIVGLIEEGTASRSDLAALLIYLREGLDDHDLVKDIANCIAHSKRNKGIAFEYIDAFINNFIDCAQNGGKFTVKTLFPLEQVVERLAQDLQGQGLNVQADVFRRQATLLHEHLRDILDGVKIDLHNPHVFECSFDMADGEHPTFRVRFQGLEHARVLQLFPKVAMAFPVLNS